MGSRRSRVCIAFAAIGLVAACKHDDGDGQQVPPIKLSGAQRAQLDQQIARSKQRAGELDRTWAAAIASVDPAEHTTGAPCRALTAVRRGLAGNPQTDDWGSWDVLVPPLGFNASSIASLSHTPFPMDIVQPGTALPTQSPELRARLSRLARASADPSWESFETRLAAVTIDALTTADVLIALDRVEQPRKLDQTTFAPGLLVGRVWVFDHARGAVVCAGVATATSSKEVDTSSSNLNDDLLITLVRGLPDQVFAVGDAPPAPTAGTPLVLHGDAGDVALPVGRVRMGNHVLHVVLGDQDPGCADRPEHARLAFDLPAGPGGNFYTGHKLGVAVQIEPDQTVSELAPQAVAIKIAPFEHAAGAHLRGSLDLGSQGGGDFDAIVCPEVDFTRLHPLPGTAPDRPFAGTLAGQPFAVRSAIARVDRDGKMLSQLRLFAKPGVTCAIGDDDAGVELRIADIGGASVARALWDSPQPALSALRGGGAMVTYDTDAMWVRLDRAHASFAKGQTITGAIAIDAPPDHASGTFRATVCP